MGLIKRPWPNEFETGRLVRLPHGHIKIEISLYYSEVVCSLACVNAREFRFFGLSVFRFFVCPPPKGARGSKWINKGSLTHSGSFCVVGVKGMGVVWGVVAELVAETPKHVLLPPRCTHHFF